MEGKLDAKIDSFIRETPGATLADMMRIFMSKAKDHYEAYETGNRAKDVDSAVLFGRMALQVASKCAMVSPDLLLDLSLALQRRFDQYQQIPDIDEAVKLCEQALDLTPQDPVVRAKILDQWADCLEQRSGQLNSDRDLSTAVTRARQAVNIIVSDDEHAGYLHHLANRLELRFHRGKHLPDLDEAIVHSRHATTLSVVNDSDRAVYLHGLASRLGTRYELFTQEADLIEAIDCGRKSWAIESDGAGGRLPNTKILRTLVNQLELRHSLSQDIAFLNEAIELSRAAVTLKAHDSTEIGRRLTNLENLLESHLESARNRPVVGKVTGKAHQSNHYTSSDDQEEQKC